MQERNYKIDFIKTMAIIFVIGIHVLANALYDYQIGSKSFLLTAFYRSVVASAVPLFIMCSGALLFDKSRNISIGDIFKKYIPRVLIPLIFWASIYELLQIYYRYTQVGVVEMESIKLALKNMISFNHNYQLYFIYIMFLFYLFTPIVKIFINNAKTEHIRYFLFVWFALGIVLPTFLGFEVVGKFRNLTQYISMPMGYASIGYGVLGYYISQNTKKTSTYVLAFVSGLVLSIILTIALCMYKNDVGITFWGGMSFTVAMMSYGFFGMVYSSDFKFFKAKFVAKLSNASFAIFLVHDIFLKILFFKGIQTSSFPVIIAVPTVMLIVFICSYILYLLLSKIGFVRKYLI